MNLDLIKKQKKNAENNADAEKRRYKRNEEGNITMKTIIFTAIASAFISISAYHFIVGSKTFYEDAQTCESSSQPELELAARVPVLQQEKPVAQQSSKVITKSHVVSLSHGF